MVAKFNDWLALKITDAVSTMWMAYLFALLALASLPAILSTAFPQFSHLFPHWLLSVSLISIVAWIAQTFLQLVLLSVIMVGQKLQADTTIQHVKKLHKHVDKIHRHLGIK
jgi:hypothetical protein